MRATSSPTSSGRSSTPSRAPAIGWSILAAVVIAFAFLGRAAGGEPDRNVFYRYEFAVGSVLIYGLLVGLTVALASAYGRPLEALGLRRFAWWWVGVAALVVIATIVLAVALEPLLHAGEEQGLSPERWRPSRAPAFATNGFVAATVVPFAEEVFFRGLGVRALSFLGGLAAVLVTAIAFGLGHGVVVALPVLVGFGLALGWMRLRSGSVWPGVIAHGAYNGLAVLIAFATVQ